MEQEAVLLRLLTWNMNTIWDVESVSRLVRVNRNSPPQDMVNVAGSDKAINPNVLMSMPIRNFGQGMEIVEVVFFHLIGQRVTEEEVEAERAARGLVKDIYAQLAVNKADPTFMNKYGNGVSWCDAAGKRCMIANVEDPEDHSRLVFVDYKLGELWFGTPTGGWWFAGVRLIKEGVRPHLA